METTELLETISRGEDGRHQFKRDVTNEASLAGGELPKIDFMQPDLVNITRDGRPTLCMLAKPMAYQKAQTLYRQALQAPWLGTARLSRTARPESSML